MLEPVRQNGRLLRRGYTTGTCAAAAAKAATRMLFEGCPLKEIEVALPAGSSLTLHLIDVKIGDGYAMCGVVKDPGDDPDVTRGLTIYAEAKHAEAKGYDKGPGAGNGVSHKMDDSTRGGDSTRMADRILVRAGEGIGIVTKPGLKVPVGQPAINPVPMRMIESEVSKVLPEGEAVEITLSVPGGAEVAARTFNPRLGIIGGISILGTTGIVEPMSEEAFRESLALEISQAAASGRKTLVLVPGKTGERAAVEKFGLPHDAVVEMSNFVGFMLEECVRQGISHVLLLGHHGKLGKVSAGIFNTHSRVADCRLEVLAVHAALLGASRHVVAAVMSSNTAEAAVDILRANGLMEVFNVVAKRASERAMEFTGNKLSVGCVLLSLSDEVLGFDENAGEMAEMLGCPGDVFYKYKAPARPARANNKTTRGNAKRPRCVYVIGIGPGYRDYLLPVARRTAEECDVLVGGKRALELFSYLEGKEKREIRGNLEEVATFINEKRQTETVGVLASGDPGLYSILGFLCEWVPRNEIEVIPGVSSVQLCCARAKIAWNDLKVISLHGRGPDGLVEAILANPKVAILTDNRFTPPRIARFLLENGVGNRRVIVAENLSYPKERLIDGNLETLAHEHSLGGNCVMVVGDVGD
ncbi:MAG: cobalamin biosynthesis protein CbiD [Firmicutes bacterium]|nr:cobalamin biosynthesis protein CbiD [Bacillota bacterium]